MGTRFEVGEVYKTREGQELEFVAHVPRANPSDRAVFLRKDGNIIVRCEDGRLSASGTHSMDVIQPPRKVTKYSVLWYQAHEPEYLYRGSFHDSYDVASKQAADLVRTDPHRVILPITSVTYEVQE